MNEWNIISMILLIISIGLILIVILIQILKERLIESSIKRERRKRRLRRAIGYKAFNKREKRNLILFSLTIIIGITIVIIYFLYFYQIGDWSLNTQIKKK